MTPINGILLHSICFILLKMSHAYFSHVSAQLNILKILIFEPLYDPLMTFYNICFIMLRMSQAYFYSSFSSVEAF